MQYDFSDKKTINNQVLNDTAKLNRFLFQNNQNELSKIYNFFNNNIKLLCVTGFTGTGKTEIVNYSFSYLKENVIQLNYTCSESTVLDDILLAFFTELNNYQSAGIITPPTIKTDNFAKKINSYFSFLELPFVISVFSLHSVQPENLQEILDFLFYIAQNKKVKMIFVSRVFDTDLIPEDISYNTLLIKALNKNNFIDYLKDNKINSNNSLYDELYKFTRGYFNFTSLIIKIIKSKNITVNDLLTSFTNSYTTFDNYIGKEIMSLLPPPAVGIFTYIYTFRHGITDKLLQLENLYDINSMDYLKKLLLLTENDGIYYVNDYFRNQYEVPINKTLALKYHKSITALYESQLPLKPSERLLSLSRQTMRNEIAYHSAFFAQKITSNSDTLVENGVGEAFKPETQKPEPISVASENTSKISIPERTFDQMYNSALNNLSKYKFNDAVKEFLSALTKIDETSEKSRLPQIYNGLAESFKNLSSWNNSLKYYLLEENYYIKQSKSTEALSVKLKIADIYYQMYKPQLALNLLNDIIEFPDLSNTVRINAYLQSAEIYTSLSDNEMSKINYEKAISIIDINTDISAKETLYFKYALLNDDIGLADIAIDYYKKCIKLNLKASVLYSSAYFNLASVYEFLGKKELAIINYQNALNADTATNNYDGMYSAATELAKINLKNAPKESLKYYKMAKNYSEFLNDNFCIATAGLALGDFYFACKQYKNALIEYLSVKLKVQYDFSKENLEKIERRISDVKFKLSEDVFNKTVSNYGK